MLWPVLGERLYHPTDPGSVIFSQQRRFCGTCLKKTISLIRDLGFTEHFFYFRLVVHFFGNCFAICIGQND